MTAALTPAARLERLQALEGEIRQGFEAFVRTGFALKEIRDEELFKEAGFATWDAYLKDRVGQEFGIERAHAYRLILCAQVRERVPDPVSPRGDAPGGEGDGWSQKELLQFARLAPKKKGPEGASYDVGRLNKRDAERVVQSVKEHCEQTGEKRTVAVVRKAVDEELGIDRAAQAKAARARLEELNRLDLPEYFNRLWGTLTGTLDALKRDVNADAWRHFTKEDPRRCRKRAVEALKALLDFAENGPAKD
jgi:hypothetical protein